MSEDQQRYDVQRALGACLFAVDDFMSDEKPNLSRLPNAARTRLTVEAALAYLVGHGLITVKPDEQWPLLLPMRVPSELMPDVVGEARARGVL